MGERITQADGNAAPTTPDNLPPVRLIVAIPSGLEPDERLQAAVSEAVEAARTVITPTVDSMVLRFGAEPGGPRGIGPVVDIPPVMVDDDERGLLALFRLANMPGRRTLLLVFDVRDLFVSELLAVADAAMEVHALGHAGNFVQFWYVGGEAPRGWQEMVGLMDYYSHGCFAVVGPDDPDYPRQAHAISQLLGWFTEPRHLH